MLLPSRLVSTACTSWARPRSRPRPAIDSGSQISAPGSGCRNSRRTAGSRIQDSMAASTPTAAAQAMAVANAGQCGAR